MGGDRLAAQMLSVRPDIPIIIYTGYSERFSEQEAITLGVKKFIFKPVDIATLAVTIREVLDEGLPGLPKSQDK
jgi:DNA-binding NtrC family response regulator